MALSNNCAAWGDFWRHCGPDLEPHIATLMAANFAKHRDTYYTESALGALLTIVQRAIGADEEDDHLLKYIYLAMQDLHLTKQAEAGD
eukprot:3835186-Amphidinium_carterae.1